MKRAARSCATAVAASVVLAIATPAFAGDDDLGSAPLGGPSAADLGADPGAEPSPDPASNDGDGDEASSTSDGHRGASPSSVSAGADGRAWLRPSVAAPTSERDAADKALKLRQDLEQALGVEPADARSLDAYASLSVPGSVMDADPSIETLQRLARARALVGASRLDEADRVVDDAMKLADALPATARRRAVAAVRTLDVMVDEARARPMLRAAPCGRSLGLARLADEEARARTATVAELSRAYHQIAVGPDPLWGRRAALRVAVLSAEMLQRASSSGTYRGVALPSPAAIDDVDAGALLHPTLRQWSEEIRRTYVQLLADASTREADPALVAQINARGVELGRIELPAGERVENPWRTALVDGVVRDTRGRAERRTSSRWTPVEARVGIDAMKAALQGPPGVALSYALVGLAEAQPDVVPTALVVQELRSADVRAQVFALAAVDALMKGRDARARAAAFYEPVVDAWRASSEGERAHPFTSVAASVFGRPERALRALKSILDADRDRAPLVLADERLPLSERVWLVAETGNTAIAPRLQQLAYDKDPQVAAWATWALWQSQGKNGLYAARPTSDGVVGCVSRAILAAAH